MKVKDIEVGTRIGESSKFRIYLGKKADGQSVILKVAKTFEDGVVLAKESAKLYQMSLLADEIETFEKKGGVPGTSYNWLFAKIETSFMEPTQDDRRIMSCVTIAETPGGQVENADEQGDEHVRFIALARCLIDGPHDLCRIALVGSGCAHPCVDDSHEYGSWYSLAADIANTEE